MKWIDTIDIRNWALRRDCQETLPFLVRKLIRATSKSIKNIKFPAGENVLLGGWDGILDVTDETEYLPSGVSLWEFGTNSDPKGKADDDYEKRSKKPLEFEPAKCTFIFVTPRLWENGEKWAKEKKSEGIWKEVKVYNAEILEEWLELAPTVSSWLATIHLGKYPSEGIQSSEFFWDQWATGPSFKLPPEILLGGRKKQIEELLEKVEKPSVIGVKDASKEEALAFIISCFKSDVQKQEDFFARSLIVENPETFKQLSVINTPLFLLPLFDDVGTFNYAISKGHTVIVPLGADSSDRWSNITILPLINREAFIQSLTKIGITKDIAEKYSKESARNITILRRQLEFIRNIPVWAQVSNVKEIIPALIAGRWDENCENDKNILAKLAGESYEEYSKKLNRWLYAPDSPLVKIGNIWRLASPLDAWSSASKNLTRNDFELLRISFLEIMNEINPALELDPGKRHMASIYGKRRQFSEWIREGITQSLILVSLYGNQLQFNLPSTGELWVDGIIHTLLNSNNPLLWKSIEDKLRLISEASPNAFLNVLEKYLMDSESPLDALFEEDPGFLSPRAYYTNLLWALEGIAWFPQYLSRVSLILAKLSSQHPGGSLLNKPINSLSEIFKPWHYQTASSFEERMEVLRLIAERDKEIGWIMLIRMLPGQHEIAAPTNKMRWRTPNAVSTKSITYQEIWNTHSYVVNLLLTIFDNSESKLSQLIKESVNLSLQDRTQVLIFIETSLNKVTQIDYTAWHSIKEILSHHRSFPDSEWAFPESDLINYEKLYNALEPVDDIEKSIWLFDKYTPDFPEGFDSDKVSFEIQEQKINYRRIEALKNLYNKFGITKIKELSSRAKEPWILGNTLGYFVEDKSEILSLCDCLQNEKNNLLFIQGFIFRKSLLKGIEWVFELYEKLKEKKFANSYLVHLFTPLGQTQRLWDFINLTNGEIINEYWTSVRPNFWNLTPDEKTIGLNYLIKFKRYFTAINFCSHYVEEIPSKTIIEILEKSATEKAIEDNHCQVYEVERLFETLDKRRETDQQTLIKLEWYFLPLLNSYSSRRSPKLLHEELSTNPDFFIEVLRCAYKPKTDGIKEKEDLSEEQIQNRGLQAYNLLHSWNKIPGVDDKGNVDNTLLTKWVTEVREKASKLDRIEAADIHLGNILAQYPEESDIWPPVEICNLIDSINTDSIKGNFSAAVFNKMGSYTKSIGEGGEQERELAKKYLGYSKKHINKFPIVASVLERLSKNYEIEAKQEDERAERDKLEY